MPGWGELFVEEVVDNCGQATHVQLVDDASSSMFIVFLLFIFPSQLTFWPFTSWADTQPSKLVDCIRAPPRRGRYWEIHPRRPRDFPRPERFPEDEARGKSRGSRISQYLPSFGGVRTFSSSSIHLQRWIRKSIPVGREGLTVLKSMLPR